MTAHAATPSRNRTRARRRARTASSSSAAGSGACTPRASCARAASDVAVTLVDRRNHHLFQPLLYQVATGALSPGEIAQPLRSIFRKQRNTTVLLGEAIGIDPGRARGPLPGRPQPPVRHADRRDRARATATSGTTSGRRSRPGLKTIDDATEIRRRILIAFEAAEREADPDRRREWMTFVLVGGGPDGRGARRRAGRDRERHAALRLPVDPAAGRADRARSRPLDRILPMYPPDRSASATQQLERLGVTVRTRTRVVGHRRRVACACEDARPATEEIRARTVLWAAGVLAASFGRTVAEAVGAETDRSGRILVGADLTIPGHPEILVVGDAAVQPWKDGRPVPGVAQGGIQGGKHAGAWCSRGSAASPSSRSATRTAATWRSSGGCAA